MDRDSMLFAVAVLFLVLFLIRGIISTSQPTVISAHQKPLLNCGLNDSNQHLALGVIPAIRRGENYTGPVFGCVMTRLSDAANEGSGDITHLYSSVNPFNADSTLVLLQKSDGVIHIRSLNGSTVRDNLYELGILPTSDAVWSPTDPNILYFHLIDSPELKSYNVLTNSVVSLHNFSSFSSISLSGEGDISFDGDHLAILADNSFGFIYTISSGLSTPLVNLSKYGDFLDVVDITPNNRLLLVHSEPGGVELFEAPTKHVASLVDYQGHSDRGLDIDGVEVLVITNSADATPIANCQNGIVKVSLLTGEENCLLSLDWSLIPHISCNNYGKGWCLVSTYSVNSTAPYSSELIYVKLDGSQVVRLGHTRTSNAEYYRTPRAAVSGNGKYVLFDSDMGGSRVDVYLLHVPSSLSGN